ncbi:CsbD family protein [Allorhodopirellula solitaria]|uniref:CsbD-like domain-containing protein n=1 Tax=Allorhodopirellula solitaria TaxID=2527987 RepID=A0A5C5XP88_9BACT|nr:CsbD family protein [Allorhodopirellula solitaria]TWT65027.1 hypothetical protein CA85_33720 [Allorhodopirellula solitaria]
MVTKQEASGQWKSIHGSVKEKYGQITDDELLQVEGDQEQLIGLIQKKVGAARSEVEDFLSKVYADCGASFSWTGDKLQQSYQGSTEMVAKHPAESVVTALGIGLLVGAAIGYSLAADRYRQPTWRDRWNVR